MPRLKNYNNPLRPVIEEITTGIPTGDATITGNLTVTGNTTLGDALGDSVTINGATVTATNAVIAAAAITTTGNVTGQAVVSNTSVTAATAITAGGNIVTATGVVQGLGVTATGVLAGVTLAVSGNSTLGDTTGDLCTVSGDLAVNRDLQVSNDAGVDGDLVVIGSTTTTTFAIGIATPQGTAAAIPDATGGVTVDTEARAALNALLADLRLNGIIAP